MVALPLVDDAGVREDARPVVTGRRNGAGAAARRETRRISVKTQRALSDEQERLRSEGLRALARIIARRALAHQGHAVSGSTGGGGHAVNRESRCNRERPRGART